MNVSIVTVVLNCKEFIRDCLESVKSQTYSEIQHIIIDGGSTDGTLEVIRENASSYAILISEPDLGYYDALNKGIQMSNGVVLGILNADDRFASVYVVENVMKSFKLDRCDAVYGNVNYIKRDNLEIVQRKWEDSDFDVMRFKTGWMPAHTSLFLNSSLFDSYGNYSLFFGTCADYDLIIRFLYLKKVKTIYRDELFIAMRTGGMSNGSFAKLWQALKNDYLILKSHNFKYVWIVLILKKLRKLQQYQLYV